MMGTLMPARRPISGAKMPPALTTTSARMVLRSPPCSTSTPVTRPFSTPMASTRVWVRTEAPPARAPAARASASPDGSSQPSLGSHTAPSTPSREISGKRSPASAGLISSSGSPKVRAQATCRRSSSRRSGVPARRMDPTSCHVGSTPVSWSSCRYSAALSIIIRVSVVVLRSCPTSPAEWKVDPLVSSARSSSTTSRQPSWARW